MKPSRFSSCLPLRVSLPRHIRQDQPTQIGNVLAFREFAVDLDIVNDRVSRVLVHDALRALFKLRAIFLGPPVAQIAFGVKLASLIVKAVRQFMANGAAGVAVIGSIIHLGIVERRLQNARGKVDVIHLRIVVSIHRGRSHAPLAAIQWFSDLCQLASRLKHGGAMHVAHKIIALDLH